MKKLAISLLALLAVHGHAFAADSIVKGKEYNLKVFSPNQNQCAKDEECVLTRNNICKSIISVPKKLAATWLEIEKKDMKANGVERVMCATRKDTKNELSYYKSQCVNAVCKAVYQEKSAK